jgi:3-oxoadipate enol-lactonase
MLTAAVPTITVNGLELYHERRGSGPRLFFFNGSGATLVSSGPLIWTFADRCDVVAHDQRGLGRSAIPPGPYSMADYAADAVALLDHLEWETCRVIGVSFGGMVAQELAATWPERVERLALLCTSPGGVGGASYPLHELADLPAAERAAIGLRILDTRFTPEWLEAHPADRSLAEMMAARGDAPRSAERRRGEAEQLVARRHHDVSARLSAVTCPTLVACGRYDGIAPPANSEWIASRIAGAELRVYEGGHAFFIQDPQALPDIRAFVAAEPRA